MKRADLATPKGIDHDYNYLTSIERQLDQAEKNAISRGVVLEEEQQRWGKQLPKGEKQLNGALEICGVIVTKAPKGMTRSKQNKTISTKKNRTLQWTVEWVHPDGKRTLGALGETQCISTAYDDHLRHLDPDRPKKKRKLDQRHSDVAASIKRRPHQRHSDFVAATLSESSSLPVHDSNAGTQPNGCTTTASVGKRKRQEEVISADHDNMAEDSNMAVATGLGDPGAVPTSTSIPAPSDPPPVTELAPSLKFNFYLHHPSLPSRHTVLIPLPSDAKLATSLTNRIVLEFPTIYVLEFQPDGNLPEGYVSEEEFFAAAKKELIEEIPGEGLSVSGLGGNVKGKAYEVEDGEVDEGRLLEVLGKDLKGVVGSL